MIGNVDKLIKAVPIPNCTCPECEAKDSLLAQIYSKIFILKLFFFVHGKTAQVTCVACKKFYITHYFLPAPIQDKVEDIMAEVKHKWYAYSGYAIIGGLIILSFFVEHKK